MRNRSKPEQCELHYGTERIRFVVMRSDRRKKTIEVRVDRGGVIVAAPRATSTAQIREVVAKRAAWILSRLGEGLASDPARALASGRRLPYRGGELCLEVMESPDSRVRVRLVGAVLRVTVPTNLAEAARDESIRAALMHWYARRATEWLGEAVTAWSAASKYVAARVLVRDQRRRWGSCAADGTLRFNWRIVMAEPALLEYVVVHELVHLRHKNHAREFWDAVGVVMPDYRQRRARLKEIGPKLTL